MSTLITKLVRKKRIILPPVHLSQIVLSAVTSVVLILSGSSRRKTHPLPVYVSAKFHLDIFNSKQDIVIGIFHIRSINCLANERFFD